MTRYPQFKLDNKSTHAERGYIFDPSGGIIKASMSMKVIAVSYNLFYIPLHFS